MKAPGSDLTDAIYDGILMSDDVNQGGIMMAIAAPWSAIWTIGSCAVRADDPEVDARDDFVPASRGAPRAARDIGLRARREQDVALLAP